MVKLDRNRLANVRREYQGERLSPQAAPQDPLDLFGLWLESAVEVSTEPTAMVLSTVTGAGTPVSRFVLLKGFDHRGFEFFTNYDSRKARELDANPNAALCFYWREMHRQIRIEGQVERVEEGESDEYFASRPRESQLGAWASPQSRSITEPELSEKLAEIRDRFEGKPVPRPPYWGGFRLTPVLFEFWQGQPSRLHDRVEYVRTVDGWGRVRLAP